MQKLINGKLWDDWKHCVCNLSNISKMQAANFVSTAVVIFPHSAKISQSMGPPITHFWWSYTFYSLQSSDNCVIKFCLARKLQFPDGNLTTIEWRHVWKDGYNVMGTELPQGRGLQWKVPSGLTAEALACWWPQNGKSVRRVGWGRLLTPQPRTRIDGYHQF